MSLRWRLVLLIGGAFLFVWASSTAWLLSDMGGQLMRTLDARLEDSARLVATLVSRHPELARDFDPRLLGDAGGGRPHLQCQILRAGGPLPDAATAATRFAGRTGFRIEEVGGNRWRSYTLAADGLLITVADRLAERERLFAAERRAAALPVLLALPFSFLLLWLGIRHGLSPLTRLRRALARHDPRHHTPLPEHDLPAEIAPLAGTLNALLARVSDTMQREARFTSNAAHELRTPLTAIKTHLQVARMCEGETAHFSLAQAEDAADHMQRMLAQLLLLARLDAGRPWPAEDPVPVAELLVDVVTRHSGDGRLDLCNAATPDSCLAVPPELAAVALRNLVDNALHHAPAGSAVTLQARHTPAGIRFVVRDRGPGVPAAELARLGERFHRRGDYPGCGLGLALVRAIAARFGGSLDFANARPGLSAVLLLPASPASAPGAAQRDAGEDEDAAEDAVLQLHHAGVPQQRPEA